MSGWHLNDQTLEVNTGDDFPAQNNITIAGIMPHDQVPAPMRSRSVTEAHIKSMRLYRKYCRYMPFLIGLNGMQKHTDPERAKMQIAAYWRTQNKVRSIINIDNFVRSGYERLYNMQNGDVWSGTILDQIAPVRRGNIEKS